MGAKDSMNSSFADSIENNLEGKQHQPGIKQNFNNNDMPNPMQFSENGRLESRVVSPNEGTDGWLNNLISKKGGPKKVCF